MANPAWSYVEFRCKYFDDLGWSDDGYAGKLRNGFVTQHENDCVKDFHRALDDYTAPNGAYDPASILNDLNWQAIVAAGHKSIVELGNLITDPEEKNALFEKPVLTSRDFTWPK